jgi:hypothetical protein
MKGKVLSTYKYSEMPNSGTSIEALISAARVDDVTQGWDGPVVALAWDHKLGLPALTTTFGYPLLLIELPSGLGNEVRAMANGALEIGISSEPDGIAGWTCFTMTGIGHVIELNAADMFPLLRLSNQGCILVALACDKEVTVVEYDFCRHDLLNVSAALFNEHKSGRGYGLTNHIDTLWGAEHSQVGGVHYWQPAVVHVDDEERF